MVLQPWQIPTHHAVPPPQKSHSANRSSGFAVMVRKIFSVPCISIPCCSWVQRVITLTLQAIECLFMAAFRMNVQKYWSWQFKIKAFIYKDIFYCGWFVSLQIWGHYNSYIFKLNKSQHYRSLTRDSCSPASIVLQYFSKIAEFFSSF